MEEKEIKPTQPKPAEKQPNLLYAILSAIGLALVGCVLYGVLYYVGYIAWIASLVVVLASGWGYKHFNKKMDWKGYLTITIVSVAGLIITMFIALTIYVAKEFGMSFGAAFKQLFTLINDRSDIRSAVIKDGALTAVFTLLGILFYWFNEMRATKLVQKKKGNENKGNVVVINNNNSVNIESNKTETKEAKETETPAVAPVPVENAKAEKVEEKKTTAVSETAKPTKPKTTTTKPAEKKPLTVKPVVSSKPKTTASKTTTSTKTTVKPKTTKSDDKKGE